MATTTPLAVTVYRTTTFGVYSVPSQSFPKEVYTTDIRDAAHPVCNCPAGQHDFKSCTHVGVCKHVRACSEYQETLLAEMAWSEFWGDPLPAKYLEPVPAWSGRSSLATAAR